MLIRHRHGAGHIQFRTSWTNGKFTVIISKTRRRSTHIRSSRQQPERPRAEDPASQNEASTAAVRQNGHRNVNRSTTPPSVKLDNLAEEGSLSEIRSQFWNRYRTKHLAVIIPFRQLAFGCYRELENASFSLRHMKKIRTVHHQVMPTKMQKKPPSISTHSRTRQKRLRSPEPSSWHDWGAAASKHVVKFRRGVSHPEATNSAS